MRKLATLSMAVVASFALAGAASALTNSLDRGTEHAGHEHVFNRDELR